MGRDAYVPFDLSAPAGREAEWAVATAFLKGGWIVRFDDDYSRRDFWIQKDDVPFWVEVKDETRQAGTGNICVEMRQGEPQRWSGANVTDAQLWVHLVGAEAVIYQTERMRELIHNGLASKKYRELVAGDNANVNVLVPIRDFDHCGWAERCPLSGVAKSRVFRRGPGRYAGKRVS